MLRVNISLRRHLIKIQLNERKQTPKNKIKVYIFKTHHFLLTKRLGQLLGKDHEMKTRAFTCCPEVLGSSV